MVEGPEPPVTGLGETVGLGPIRLALDVTDPANPPLAVTVAVKFALLPARIRSCPCFGTNREFFERTGISASGVPLIFPFSSIVPRESESLVTPTVTQDF